MKERDPEMFFKATRMTPTSFDLLLNLVKGKLEKNSIRKPILAECRLALTVIYLAHGGPRRIYALKFRMDVSTVGRILLETCESLWDELWHIYIALPSSSEWCQIVEEYKTRWGLPNCLGAIDGKHVFIVCPKGGGSQYYSYKGRHSVVPLAVCDANYTFTAVDIGAYGSQSDGGIFHHSGFGKLLMDGKLQIATEAELPNSTIKFPFYFVGDAAFLLTPNLMRPYPGNNLSPKLINFNKRTSRARVTIENTFGIMVARWRVMRNDIHCAPENVDKIIKAVVVLHNFLKLNDHNYCPDNYGDRCVGDEVLPGLWRSETTPLESTRPFSCNNSKRDVLQLRHKLCDNLHSNL